MVSKIILDTGDTALCDDGDYDRLIRYAGRGGWKLSARGDYARARSHFMQYLLLKAPPGKVIDHINGNGLDNQRHNLRICTQSENVINSKTRKDNSSGVKGVSFRKTRGTWDARIQRNGKLILLGQFKTKEAAILARMEAEKCPLV